MIFLYTQPVIQADATGIILFALFLAPFIIPPIVKKSKISEAEVIKEGYPDGYRKVCRDIYYLDYKNAKKVVNRRSQIVTAQREYEEELRKEAEEKRIREKVNDLRRECPYATQGKLDQYIIDNEYIIRQAEKKHNERTTRAKQILHDYPLGVRELYGFISDYRITDDDIDKLINNETNIQNKQRECEANEAELQILRPQINALRKKCPLAVLAICRERNWLTSNAEHVKLLLLMPGEIAERQEKEEECLLASKERMASAVNDAKTVITNYNKDRARSYTSRRYGERIADKVMEIIRVDEDFRIISKHLDSVGIVQNAFAKETRQIIPDILKDWGYYKYSFTMQYLDDNSNVKSNSLYVWQAFYDSCCFDDSVSYDYYPGLKKNRVYKSQLESTYSYTSKIWDKVMSFLLQIKSKYGDELFVILANTNHLDENAFQNNFNYIEDQLKKANISYGDSMLTEKLNSLNKKYVVIDIITYNSNLIQYCSSLFHYRHIMHVNDNTGTTGVVFLSMLKCYDGAEVEDLNKMKIKEREDALRKAKEEAERTQREQRYLSEAKSIASTYPIGFNRYFPNVSSYSLDVSQAKSIVLAQTAIRDYEETLSRLRNDVSGWDTVRGIPHYFFYYYYPTRFTGVSAVSQEARRLVYNFKDGIAHSKVKDLVVTKIRTTFSSNDLSKMCFACIPASSRSVHRSRYEDFSNEVSQALGMSNAYNYITITKEKRPAHLGSDDRAEYSYDRTFFEGKFVVLFDDIVTRGGSVSSMKSELEALGAIVVCAISIGRTYSDWNGNSPIPHPWTGTY